MKKIISLALAFVAFASFASAATNDELAVQYANGEITVAELIAGIVANSNTTATTTTTASGTEKTYVYTRLLKVGKRGNDVRELQKCLNRLNSNTGVADGIFGPNTNWGVKDFQSKNGLKVDGIIGRNTGPKFEAACMVGGTTTGGTTTGGTTTGNITGDKLVVSGVASDDMVIGGEQTVVFAKLMLAAGDKDVKVKDINVEFTGSANRAEIMEVKLLNSSMVEIDDDTIDSDNEASLDVDLEVRSGKTLTLYVAAKTANFVTAKNGLDVSLKVVSVKTDGAVVEGDEIAGAVHELHTGVTVDTFNAEITVEETGTVRIGEDELKVATVNVENKSSEDDKEIVKSMELTRINHTGSLAGDDALDNVVIKVDGKTYEATQDDEDYTFDFGNGIELDESGDDFDFELLVDVKDDAGDKFAFMLKDIVVVDEDGVILVQDDTDNSGSDANEITAQYTDATDEAMIDTSDVVINSTTDVNSEKVSAGSEGVELVSFEVDVTGSDVEGDVKVTVELNGAAAATNTKDIDLDNVAIYDKSGDRISDKEGTSFTAVANGTTYIVTFDDVKIDEDDDTQEFVIKADVNTEAVDGTNYKITNIAYVSVEDENGDDVTVSPESISSPAVIEVESADLAVSVENADDQNVNSNIDGVAVAEIKLDASNSGDDINISKIKLAFAVADVSGGATVATIADLDKCELFDGSTSVSDAEDAAGSVTYNVDIDVSKDTEKTLVVKCDIGNKFENTDTITVTGISFDAEGETTSVDVDTAATIAAFAATNTVATITDGTMVLKLETGDVNDDKVVKDDANNVVLGVYEFEAKDNERTIEKVDIVIQGFGNVDGKVDLYINGNLEESENPNAGGLVNFTGISRDVAKDEKVTIMIKADMNDSGANAGIVQVSSFGLYDADNNPTAPVNGTQGANKSDSAPYITVVEALPIVTALDVNTSSLVAGNNTILFAYKVKAEGGDVTMGNTVFEISNTDAELANIEVKVFDEEETDMSQTGNILNADFIAITSGTGTLATPVARDADLTSVVIPDNDTYFVYLIADNTAGDDADVRVKITDVTYVADTTGFNFAGLEGELLIEGDMESILTK